jgi:hypothetical protein
MTFEQAVAFLVFSVERAWRIFSGAMGALPAASVILFIR